MIPDRWPDVERVYDRAIGLPVDERGAFLDTACAGDDALRREVESLLSLETAATGFLEQPALRAAATTLSRALPHLRPPEVPGYHIIRELGEGGMGVVYLAEQRTPLQRVVALKLIRPGMDSRQVLARFERERQALARMDHPNIAAVFDAGSAADGRPYFVMELVDGVSITEYCDSRQLPIRARLALFIQVCNAVQHAHQKGVIHRDLKPSNVLVIDQDGQPVPKVIDFGTAKSADRTGDGATLTTDGLVFGTVEYMSPEQAAFSTDIDTTTDVYSLGVLLYELLVGCTPFNRQTVDTHTLDAILKAIRDSDPPRPSTLVSRDKTFRASVSARGTDVGVLARQLSGDLDWIVLKALEKDRDRRYQTAASLGADVQRFQDSKPIEARPPSVPYRIRKFTRRYRGTVVATAALALSVILGLVISTTLYWRSERDRKEVDVQRGLAESGRVAADAATRVALAKKDEADRFREEAERQTTFATQSADSLRSANSELAYSRYTATIIAAQTEIGAGKLTSARERLALIPQAQRNWEWRFLFNQTEGSVFQAASATPPCNYLSGAMLAEYTQVLSVDSASGDIVLRQCDAVETWAPSGAKRVSFQAPLTKEAADLLARLRVLTTQKVLAVEPGSKLMVVASTRLTPSRDVEWLIRLVGAQRIVELGWFTESPDCADIARDGEHVVIGLRTPRNASLDYRPQGHSFEVWRIGVGRLHRFVPPQDDRIDLPSPNSCHVRFSPDGKLVVSSRTTVDVWNAESGGLLFRDERRRPGIYGQPVVFSPTGDRLAIGRSNGSIDIVQVAETQTVLLTLSDGRPDVPVEAAPELRPLTDILERPRAITAMGFSPDGSTLAAATVKAVTVWDLVRRKSLVQADHKADLIGVAISPDGRLVYSADATGEVRGWPLRFSSAVTQSPFTFPPRLPILMNSSATSLAGVGLDGELSILRLPDLHRIEVRPGSGKPSPDTSLRGLAVSGDGARLFIAEARGVRILELPNGRTLQAWQMPPCEGEPALVGTSRLENIALSSDDRYLAVGQFDCVFIVEAATFRRVASLRLRLGLPKSMVFRKDGVLIVATNDSSEAGGRFRLQAWDWRAKTTLANIYPEAENQSPTRLEPVLTITADGKKIGILSYRSGLPGTLSIWDSYLQKELGRLPVGDSTAVALNQDGSRAVTVSRQTPTVQVWDTGRATVLLTLTDTDGHLGGVAFASTGQIIAGRSSGGITIYDPRYQSRPTSR